MNRKAFCPRCLKTSFYPFVKWSDTVTEFKCRHCGRSRVEGDEGVKLTERQANRQHAAVEAVRAFRRLCALGLSPFDAEKLLLLWIERAAILGPEKAANKLNPEAQMILNAVYREEQALLKVYSLESKPMIRKRKPLKPG